MKDDSLISILKSNPALQERIRKQIALLEKDKEKVKEAASSYAEEYRDEVSAGTEKMKKLLTEGMSRGLTKEQVVESLQLFIPSDETPILNMLHFILRESEEIDRSMYQVRNDANKKITGWDDDYTESENVKSPDDMFSYLYGDRVTLTNFQKLKKLKSLTKSPEIEEATLAFQKCRELCEKYDIDYDKIPVYN